MEATLLSQNEYWNFQKLKKPLTSNSFIKFLKITYSRPSVMSSRYFFHLFKKLSDSFSQSCTTIRIFIYQKRVIKSYTIFDHPFDFYYLEHRLNTDSPWLWIIIKPGIMVISHVGHHVNLPNFTTFFFFAMVIKKNLWSAVGFFFKLETRSKCNF